MFAEIDIEKNFNSKGEPFHLKAAFSASHRTVVLLGPSGSGKSLTLAAIAGIITPDRGIIKIRDRIFFDSKQKINISARNRDIGYVFQDYALFPHLTVFDNVAYSFTKGLRSTSKEQRAIIEDMLHLFGISGLADRKPSQISIGQKQRVAIARALVKKPSLLLLDEPFSALDQPYRAKMRGELQKIQGMFDIPIILVTHDPADAQQLVETLVVYKKGSVEHVCNSSKCRMGQDKLKEIIEKAFSEPVEDSKNTTRLP